MPQSVDAEPTIIVLFGAGGDLAHRKLIPALYDLFLSKRLPEQFTVVGVSRTEMSDDQFREHLRSGVDQLSRRCKSDDPDWANFAPRLTHLAADPTVKETYTPLYRHLDDLEKNWQAQFEDAKTKQGGVS
jgi:glucose-6-phosphate 1-dehydrogenase